MATFLKDGCTIDVNDEELIYAIQSRLGVVSPDRRVVFFRTQRADGEAANTETKKLDTFLDEWILTITAPEFRHD